MMVASTPTHPLPDQPKTNLGCLELLEQLCLRVEVPFDRIATARVLGEAERAWPAERDWTKRLREVGESVDLRLSPFEGSVQDVIPLVREGAVVVTYGADAEGAIHWYLLSELRRGRVRVRQFGASPGEFWLSPRKLRRWLDPVSPAAPRQWATVDPAMSCESSSARAENAGGGKPTAPHNRLLGLLRPERPDLWVIAIFSAVVGVLTLASPIAVEALVNTVAFGRFMQPVVVLAALLFTFLAFAGAMRALVIFIAEVIQRRLFARVVADLAYRLPRLRKDALDGEHGSELVNRFFDVVTVQKTVAFLLLSGIALVLQTIIGMAVLAFYHPYLLGFDVVLLGLIAITIFGLGRGAVETSIKESKYKYKVAAWLQELARHPVAFKLPGGAEYASDRADDLLGGYLLARQSHFRILMRQILFALAIYAVAATVLLGLGGWLVIQGQLTLGQLVAAELIVMMILGSFAKLGKHLESYYDLLASVDKLGVLFDLPIESHDKLFHPPGGGPASVRVQRAAYRYADGTSALRGVSLDMKPGARLGLSGPSGTGKSTLVDLLFGTRQPAAGDVELDGIDYREIRPDSLREHVALARSIEIFAGSIDENVRLNRPQISAADVREALAAVSLLEELPTLRDGLNTQLQTDGEPLSQSQAKRLMLARAIVGRPRLLLVDGILDGLPDDILPKVLDGLVDPEAPWTLLMISGRQEVLERCDTHIHWVSERQDKAAVMARAG